MSPFEKLTGNKPKNRIGLENPDATLVTMVKNPLEQPLGTQKLDALDLAEYESTELGAEVETWLNSDGSSMNRQNQKSGK